MSDHNFLQLPSNPKTNYKAQILVLHNQLDIFLTLENILQRDHYAIMKAYSLKEALRLVMQQNFSLIILDIQANTLNTNNIIRAFRENEITSSIPIILIVTGNKDPTNYLNGYPFDNIEYVFTPIDPITLSLKISKAIQGHFGKDQSYNPAYQSIGIIPQKKADLYHYYQSQFKKTKHILDGIAEAYIAIDRNWKITYCNRTARLLLNSYPQNNSKGQLVGCFFWDLIEDYIKAQIYEPLQEAMLQHKPVDIVVSASETWFKFRACPIEEGLTIYCIDITEQKKLEEEIARLERLKLISQMAAGITHEVRNPITVVRAVLDLARLANKPISLEKINVMIQEIDRANSIITEFLSLSETKDYTKELVSLDKLVADLAPLIEAKVNSSGKHLVLDLQKCKAIYLCSKKIHQLLLNLVINGLEAMENQGETLTIQTYQKDNGIYLKITDEGPGITIGDLKNIWDPFFTTKINGTGLGLAICNSIVNNHNGIIDVETNNKGTSFIVRFRQFISKAH